MDLSKKSKGSKDNAPKQDDPKPANVEFIEMPKKQESKLEGKSPLPKTEAEFKQKFLNLKLD
jgi:hypothetical protein